MGWVGWGGRGWGKGDRPGVYRGARQALVMRQRPQHRERGGGASWIKIGRSGVRVAC